MADNHIGSALVSAPRGQGLVGILTDRDLALAVLGGDLDPDTTQLDDVMSEEIITCDIGADLDEIVRLIQGHGIRRIPIVEDGKPVGLVTFDDLVADGSVGLDALRAIVSAQLEVEAPQKPAGMRHPGPPPAGRARALVRARARAEATYRRFVDAAAQAAELDRDRAERALVMGLCMLCRRLTPQEAAHLIAQLPSMLQPRLNQCLDGPDRAVTAAAIGDEFARTLGLDRSAAYAALQGIFKAVAASVAPGQIDEVRGQLPNEMKELFPAP